MNAVVCLTVSLSEIVALTMLELITQVGERPEVAADKVRATYNHSVRRPRTQRSSLGLAPRRTAFAVSSPSPVVLSYRNTYHQRNGSCTIWQYCDRATYQLRGEPCAYRADRIFRFSVSVRLIGCARFSPGDARQNLLFAAS
jgi:hypothetical protein